MSNMIDRLLYSDWKPAVGEARFALKCIDSVQKHRLYHEKQPMYYKKQFCSVLSFWRINIQKYKLDTN